ncbi:MAG TPA: type I-B CRISPR-associated protein Cas7/Csh2 [Dictyoglomaceae bacterium]|nr:type I-B CRISPR-associated protein Cas7/Csh2 [Dictyoglomaceae bacterium]HOL39932.1 type I-B CRISPR-associated protein Cas7/Csh2 [Dictyoglomaceae bacterium]HPP16394.1 type I-B CRISPR-associated protein Cas7/Csh2 [Dictyoglomaceae bacterium]HPU44125.1 type I-B CRISPR-associated protein Cas7/Csh2 [Dictyoglomaceae bacterium]
MAELRNRSEILFLYDVTDANPNGDPVDENKPRIDEETGVNIVTDVRLKRTIRDYLYEYKGQEVFIREIREENGELKTKEKRLGEFKDTAELIGKCIDIRLFGATTAVEKKTMVLTGPVQFKFGRSLHKVDLTYIKGTTVMPSAAGKAQGTFTEKYILPYSLIGFYGIVNENAAKVQDIPLTEEDVDLMLEAMWHGTKDLISGSKFGQMPRLLLQVVHKPDSYFYIGELDKRIKLISDVEDEKIRNVSEVKIDVSELSKALEENNEKIEKIRYMKDERLTLVRDGRDIHIQEIVRDIPLEELNF